jgi:hypothetical protein
MILLILVVLWIAVLAPGLLKRRSERHSAESIESFHYQLHVLEQTGPKVVTPAYRLRTAESRTGMAVGQSGFPAITSMPGRPNLTLLQRGDSDADSVLAGEVAVPPSAERLQRIADLQTDAVFPGSIQLPCPDPYRRKLAERRRRVVLAWLLGATIVSALLGLVEPLRLMWVLTLAAGLFLAAYVTLLVYAQSLVTGQGRNSPTVRGEFQGSEVNGALPLAGGRDRSERRAMQLMAGQGDTMDAEVARLAAAGFPGAWDEEGLDVPEEGAGDRVFEDQYPVHRRAAAGH